MEYYLLAACFYLQQSLVKFFHTDDGPPEQEIERVETVIDKGLVISWRVSWSPCSYGCIYNVLNNLIVCLP